MLNESYLFPLTYVNGWNFHLLQQVCLHQATGTGMNRNSISSKPISRYFAAFGLPANPDRFLFQILLLFIERNNDFIYSFSINSEKIGQRF